MIDKIAAFAVLSLILTITPGPDGLLVLRSSLLAGRRAGARVAAGATSGSQATCCSWVSAAGGQRPGTGQGMPPRGPGGAPGSAPGCSATCSTPRSGCSS
jgi:hypothetical protein